MKPIAILVTVLSLSAAALSDIDWSKVKPIEEFDHYWKRLPTELQHLRKSFPDRRIVNGREATPGQFPYQVVTLGDFELGIGVCGGTILTNNYILTAAHCMEDSNGGIAIVGAHDRYDEEEPSQQRIAYSIADMNIHPDYTLDNIRNDIATVRMNGGITFNERVQPVRLPARSDHRTFSGMVGTVSGYGRTSDATVELSRVLRYTMNPVQTNARCLEYIREQTPNAEYMVTAQNICQSNDGGRGTCNSDSGGPLTVQDAGSSLQVGVVSFGSSVCTDGLPTVFARVSYYLDWIEENSDFAAEP